MLRFLVALILFAFFDQSHSLQENYYWREYTGTIPEDAVVAGKDINGNDLYIGQAYVKNEGLFVTQIRPGEKEFSVPIKGVKKVKKYVKILCGPLHNFAWLKVNATDFHLAMLNKHPVIGGHEDGQGQINIGRISYEGETRVGKVNAFFVGSANFRFVDNKDTEPIVKSYEVLVYYQNELQ